MKKKFFLLRTNILILTIIILISSIGITKIKAVDSNIIKSISIDKNNVRPGDTVNIGIEFNDIDPTITTLYVTYMNRDSNSYISKDVNLSLNNNTYVGSILLSENDVRGSWVITSIMYGNERIYNSELYSSDNLILVNLRNGDFFLDSLNENQVNINYLSVDKQEAKSGEDVSLKIGIVAKDIELQPYATVKYVTSSRVSRQITLILNGDKYEGTIPVGPYDENGVSKILRIIINSNEGTTFDIYNSNLGYSNSTDLSGGDFEIIDNVHGISPKLLSVTLDKNIVSNNDVVNIIINAEDYISSLSSYSYVCYRKPDGTTRYIDLTLVNGKYIGNTSISSNEDAGEWHIEFIAIRNNSGYEAITYINSSSSNNEILKDGEFIVLGDTIPVTEVSLDTTQESMNIGETTTLMTTVSPEQASNKNVTWVSSNPSIAIVDSMGNVTAVSAGTSIITVTTEDGSKTASCTVTVNKPIINVISVSLNKTTDSLIVGEADTLLATINPTDATNKNTTWISYNPTIATVDNSGKVTAVSAGTAIITVTTQDGSKTASCIVSVNNPIINVTSVSLNKTTDSLIVGEADTLFLTINPTNATNKNITWTSSNPSIATVDSLGKVTAVSAGTAIITVTTEDGSKTASYTVTVNTPIVNVTSVSLNKSTDSLIVGGADTLLAIINPTDATNKNTTWTSSNPSIATVDSTGKVTAISAGTSTITATTEDGSKTASCTVTVNIPIINVTSVSLNKTTDSLIVGATSTLISTLNPTNATNKNTKWTSSNPTIATVDNIGKVTAISAGTTTITITTEDGSKTASCTVTVNNPIINVTSVSLNKSTDSLIVGATSTLLAVINPTNATNKTTKWTSSNPTIATVDSLGKVTAISAGTSIITVTTEDGSKTASCTVTVNTPIVNVTSVSLNKSTDSLIVGEADILLATINPTDATNKNITWTSSNPSIATVDSLGKVTAISAGTTTITVTTEDGSKTASCNVVVSIKLLYDTNNDNVIDLIDLDNVKKFYNSKGGDINWQEAYDFNRDGIIDIYDLIMLSKKLKMT